MTALSPERARVISPRDAELIREYLLPTAITKLAKKFGISHQRVQQITKKHRVHRLKMIREPTTGANLRARQIREAIASGARPNWVFGPSGNTMSIIEAREACPDWSYGRIAKHLGVGYPNVAAALTRWRPDLLRRGPRCTSLT